MNDFSDMVMTFTSDEMKEHNKEIRAETIEEYKENVNRNLRNYNLKQERLGSILMLELTDALKF